MKRSFLTTKEPFICEMVQVKTAKHAIEKITNAIADGATAVGIQLHFLDKSEWTEEKFKSMFDSAGNCPIYVTNYRMEQSAQKDDDQLMEELLFALKCGATLIDMMGDTFNPSYEEMTKDESAIKKQMEFIDKVHALGGEVLMSSHIKEFRSPDHVLEVALEQQRRGVDIVKIVTGANNAEEEVINLQICNLLKEKLSVPFLFLSGGTNTKLHRTIGPALGVCMWLCFRVYDETTYGGPPLLSEVLQIKQALNI